MANSEIHLHPWLHFILMRDVSVRWEFVMMKNLFWISMFTLALAG